MGATAGYPVFTLDGSSDEDTVFDLLEVSAHNQGGGKQFYGGGWGKE